MYTYQPATHNTILLCDVSCYIIYAMKAKPYKFPHSADFIFIFRHTLDFSLSLSLSLSLYVSQRKRLYKELCKELQLPCCKLYIYCLYILLFVVLLYILLYILCITLCMTKHSNKRFDKTKDFSLLHFS